MADDLVHRARAAADTSIEPHAKHMFPQGTRHHVYGSEMRELLHALADALARKDAEIAALKLERDDFANACKHSADDLRARDAKIAELRDSVVAVETALHYATQRAERAEARLREAPVVEAIRNSSTEAAIFARDLPAEWIGKRVAIVLLDAEDAK